MGFVVCSFFFSPPHNERLYFSVFTDIDYLLHICLFYIVPDLASLFLLFETKPLP